MTYIIDKVKRNTQEYVFCSWWGGGGWEAPTLKAVIYWTGKDWSCIITEDTVMEAREYEFCDFIVCSWKTVTFSWAWPAMIKACNVFCNLWTIDLRSKDPIPSSSKTYYLFWEIANVASNVAWDSSCEAYGWHWGINKRWSWSNYFRWWEWWAQWQNWCAAPGDWYCECCSACPHASWWNSHEESWGWGWGWSGINYPAYAWASATNACCWAAWWNWSSNSFQTWWAWWGWGWFWITRWWNWGKWGAWIEQWWNGWMWWWSITWTGWTGWQWWDTYCQANRTSSWYNPWDWGKGWFSLRWTWGTWWLAWCWRRTCANRWGDWWDSVYWTWGTWGNWNYAYWCVHCCFCASNWGNWWMSVFGNWGNGWVWGCWGCQDNATAFRVNWGIGWNGWNTFYWKAGNGWLWWNTLCAWNCWGKWGNWGNAVWWQYWLLIIANEWTNNKICGKGWCWWAGWKWWCSPQNNAACLWWWVGWNWGRWGNWGNVTIFYNNSFSQWTIDLTWWAWWAAWGWGCNACNCPSASGTAWASGTNWTLIVTQMSV